MITVLRNKIETKEAHCSSPSATEIFEMGVTQNIPALYRTALRLTRNKMDAEDLVQETLFRACRFRDKFLPGSNLRAWLFRILFNQHNNEYRARLRKPRPINIDTINDNILIHHLATKNCPRTPEQLFMDKCLDDELWKAIQGLRHEFKQIVNLYFMHQLSYKQIAVLVKLNLGTVKSRLYRSRQQLRAELSDYSKRNQNATNYQRKARKHNSSSRLS